MWRAIISRGFVLNFWKIDVFQVGYNRHTSVALSYLPFLGLRQ